MTRIAFVSGMDGAPWGGSETLWCDAARRLLDLGHDVFASVAGWPQVPPALAALMGRGGIVDRRPRPTLRRRLASRAWRAILRKPGWSSAWQSIVDFRPDLVCVSHGATTCGLEWMQMCLQERIPYASICQANYEFWWPTDDAADSWRRAFQGAARTFFVSRRNLALFETQLGDSLPRAEVVWNPFNVSWDAGPAWADPDPCYKLACVARLEPRAKGHDLLFEVLSQEKWRQRPIEVNLFGDGPWERCLRRLVATRNLEGSVHFAGYATDMERVWGSHHCLILPSRYEGLPLSLVEAMLCGRPAVVTDVAGNTEVVTDNVTGFVAAAPTATLLDEAMERAWQRRGEWPQIGRAAAVAIRQRLPRDPAAELAGKLLALAPCPSSGR
ncbi:MAG: glycosyltransferase family 4 protein [Planctomycetia bacterium]